MFKGQMPSVTPAQVGALLTLIVSQAIAWGWIANDDGQKIVSIGGIVVAAVWKIADAFLRSQRAKAVAANPAAFNVTTKPIP